jgi:dTDP-4-amino-4,6-dideoxygalactose transaminase
MACYQDVPLQDPLTVARTVAAQIITLPIYHGLALEDVQRICDVIDLDGDTTTSS